MLVIRMQRTGRKGHAMFRVVVQDSRRTPTSGKVVANLGSYDPHAKTVQLDKAKAASYMEHGAQPSPRVAALLKAEGVKLPGWVKVASAKKGETRFADKRRSTAPAPEVAPVEEKPAEEVAPAEEAAPAVEAEALAEEAAPEEAPAEAEPKAEAKLEEKPAEEAPAEPETAEPETKDEPPVEDGAKS